ncbi:Rha family transcriptional regulator [Priestia flexa]|uniref:Rha family transcriptional regulator n=1 Tax=Priestia flexa TaxID=86664 RepID=UPI003D2E2675
MNELNVFELNGQLLTDSREVAEMVGKRHDHLLSDIRKYVEVLDSQDFGSHNFFISSLYKNAQNKEQPCFHLTKKGCDMVANKMNGEKGILFTARYTMKFEEMEKTLRNEPRVLTDEETRIESLKLTLQTKEEVIQINNRVTELENKVEKQITIESHEQRKLQKTINARIYELAEREEYHQLSFDKEDNVVLDLKKVRSKLFPKIHRDIKDAFAVTSYKDIRRKYYDEALQYVKSWRPKL